MKMEIEIPNGIEVEVNDEILKVKGKLGEVERKFYHPKLTIEKVDNKIVMNTKSDKKKVLAVVGTWMAHIKNMFKGVEEGFEYKMKVSHVHFPMSLSVENNNLIIKNFLGQKEPRRAKILDGVDIKINGDEITLKGIDREKVGQTAGNIEQATRLLKRRDRRIFSDGIYIVSKGEKE
ncbi:MAG: 50S ribosomal protein L6 [Candidatus Aenigmarchaeota archaeon]|nr:50S ribosomal protein L6 [Candidatus Aenigmarchaeota archaeon]